MTFAQINQRPLHAVGRGSGYPRCIGPQCGLGPVPIGFLLCRGSQADPYKPRCPVRVTAHGGPVSNQDGELKQNQPKNIPTETEQQSLLLGKSQEEWDAVLPQIMRTYCSTAHSATHGTPNFLMLGQQTLTPRPSDVFRPNIRQSSSYQVGDWV